MIRLPWRSGNQSGLSRYGSIPGKGEGIERLLSGRDSALWQYHSLTTPSRFEARRSPLRLFRFQARHDRILAVLDLAWIRTTIISPVEDRLKVERHVGVVRQEGNGDLGK